MDCCSVHYFFATVVLTFSLSVLSLKSPFSVAFISTAMPSNMLRKRSFVEACCILALTGAVSGALHDHAVLRAPTQLVL